LCEMGWLLFWCACMPCRNGCAVALAPACAAVTTVTVNSCYSSISGRLQSGPAFTCL
jgi:hypothetical protein